MLDEEVQQQLHAEVVHRRAEEHRRLPPGQILVHLERRRGALHQLEFLAQLAHGFVADLLQQARRVEALEDGRILPREILAGLEDVHFVQHQVIHALQPLAHPDRPGHRRAGNAQHRLHLVQQLDRRAALAIELVDEGHDRRVAQPAHLHQLDRAFFHTLGAVDHHQRRIHRGQHAVGVFGEVRVARRVEQVDDLALVRKLHHRRGHRDAALLLQRHPVRCRMPRRLAPLHRPGHLDRAAEQQQLFGQRGLARVRVTDDGEGAAAAGFLQMGGHGWRVGWSANRQL